MNTDNPSQQPDCSKHKKDVAGISDMKELAGMIGDLHYQTLAELLTFLREKLWKDGHKDYQAGRLGLGHTLMRASYLMQDVEKLVIEAWEISKPFMTDKTQQP